jgi:hypothetical protein
MVLGKSSKGASALLMFGLAGCLNPNLYTTPRATPVGRSAVVLAPQLVNQGKRRQNFGTAFGVRFGVVPRLDAGIRFNLGSLAADVKWNAIRSQYFDLALDAGVEVLPQAQYGHLPLLLGFNVADDVTLLANTGMTFGTGEEPEPFGDSSTTDPPYGFEPVPAGSPFVRGGLGAQVRFTPTFAVQPEVTALYYFGANQYVRNYYAGGLAFIWGRTPY